jgi:ATP/ADP translocase
MQCIAFRQPKILPTHLFSRTMKTQLLRLLKLKHTESRHVTDLLTVQFWIGISNAFINILAFSLFIKNLSVKEIPQAYLAIAGSLLLLNLVYEKLEHRYSPLHVVKIILAASAVILALLWMDLTFWDKHSAIFILLVISFLMYMLTGYAFWGLVSLLYNVRESKRVFSVVGSGDIPAKLIGYLAAPVFAKLIGYPNLIWLSIACLLAGLWQFDKVIRKKRWDHIRHKEHGHHHEVLTLRKKGYVSFFFKTELIFTISLISLISYNVFNLVDFTFLSQVKSKYENQASLATFIAVFFALGRLVALVLKLVFTSRVIERLGTVQCLFITPVALLAICLLMLFFEDAAEYTVYIFGAMALLTEVLRSTIQEPVFFILFQPLKEQLRLKGHLISKGYMLPPSLIIVGLSLIIMQRSGVEITISLTIKILLINLIAWAGFIFLLRNAYLRTLRQSIRKGVFNAEDMKVTDRETINILLEKIRTGKDTDVLYALSLLENAEYPELHKLYHELMGNPHREIRRVALDKLSGMDQLDTAELRSLLDREQDPDIRQALVGILCRTDPSFLQEVAARMEQQDAGSRKAIITSMLNQREFKFLIDGGNALNALIHSDNPADRELAIDIAAQLHNVRFTDAIEELVQDTEPAVKRQAIMAACKLRSRKLLPFITSLLNDPRDKYLALQGLLQYGDELFQHIQDLPAEAREAYQEAFIKIAGKLRGHHSTQYLLTRLAEGNSYQDQLVHALWLKNYEPGSQREQESLSGMLREYLLRANSKVQDYYEVPEFEDTSLLQESIDHEVRLDLVTALKICALLYDRTEFNRVIELMEQGDHKRLVNAIEMLELVLPKKTAKEMNAVFNYLLDPTLHGHKIARMGIEPLFGKIVHEQPVPFGPWTRAVCIYSSWKNKRHRFLQSLRNAPSRKEHYIVQETRDFVLQDIG